MADDVPESLNLDDINIEDIELPEGAELADEQYPPFVATREQRARFRMAYAIAWHVFDGDPVQTWQAARSIYQTDIPS